MNTWGRNQNKLELLQEAFYKSNVHKQGWKGNKRNDKIKTKLN